MKNIYKDAFAFLYKNIFRNILFLWDSETIHESLTNWGQRLGNSGMTRNILSYIFIQKHTALYQNIEGIFFSNPIGLAAGFDYKAELTQLLPYLGFGFGTIGTITNMPYPGNPKPRLGRLVRSKSLMVNKGFKNEGIKIIIKKLKNTHFIYPVGISIGRTNSLQNHNSLQKAIKDITSAFIHVKKSGIQFSYYELNISCPNLHSTVSFYPPENLNLLLQAVLAIRLKKPLFVKMPIDQTDKKILCMLSVIATFPIQGVIFGNLQKNKQNSAFYPKEVMKYHQGNFSGKPTEKRSNELIRLSYKKYGKKLIIIGCGGVFCAEDAYKKIKLGASLVQLITGIIYEGPQLISQINRKLPLLLAKDRYTHISQAIGRDA